MDATAEPKPCGPRYIFTNLDQMEATMPVLLWLLGVPLIVVIALMFTHVI